jgi:putative zinc finger/helix-turn-helix YgiT family protein
VKRCVECSSHALTDGEVRDKMVAVGRRFTALLPAITCSDCGAVYYDGPGLERFELMIACALADMGEHSGEALKFMRKALGIKGTELAAMLDVTPESISRWENGKGEPPRDVIALLAAMADDRLEGRTTTLMRLRAMAETRPSDESRDLGRVVRSVAA